MVSWVEPADNPTPRGFCGRNAKGTQKETILERLAWLAERNSRAAIRRVKGIREATPLATAFTSYKSSTFILYRLRTSLRWDEAAWL